jgi:chorismate mutase/prephenate dehydrogenase
MSDDLQAIREDIRGIDRQFVELLARRQQLAKRVIDIKTRTSQPLRNYSVEQRVYDRFKTHCQEYEMEEHWGEMLADLLINCSVELQSTFLDRRYLGGAQKILIVGGLGKMGNWLVRFAQNQGHRVMICDPAADPAASDAFISLEDGLRWASLTFLATPLELTDLLLQKITSLRPTCIVVDIASIKNHLTDSIYDGIRSGLKITSIHPLFGPDEKTLHGKNIVICPCGSEIADTVVSELFAETAANLVTLSLEDHDRMINKTMVLSHALNIIFGYALADSYENEMDILPLASSTFIKQMQTARDVFSENPDLYFEIQRNADFKNIYALLFDALHKLESTVGSNDRGAFREGILGVREKIKSD